MKAKLRGAGMVLTGLVALLVGLQVLNTLTGGTLMRWGIVPRSPGSLAHIFTAPFIHASWGHLLNNLLALIPLSALCLLRSVRFYLWNSLFIIVVTGLLTWLIGRSAYHVGASGWVFGLFGLNIGLAWFDRKPSNILAALLVMLCYGGLVAGILPTTRGVSFESHLSGLVAGVVCAFFYMSTHSRPR